MRKFFGTGNTGEGGAPDAGTTPAAGADKKDPAKPKQEKTPEQKAIASLTKELVEMRGELGGLKEQIRLLRSSADPAKAEAPKIPKETFEVDGQKYLFVTPTVQAKGIKRTAMEALIDNEKHEALGGLGIKQFLVANNSKSIKLAD